MRVRWDQRYTTVAATSSLVIIIVGVIVIIIVKIGDVVIFLISIII